MKPRLIQMLMRRALFLIPVFFLVSCVSKKDGSLLRIQLTSEPVSLDFSMAEDGLSLRVLGLLMGGLTSYDGDNHLQNELAEKIEILNSGSKYRIRIKDRKWSDGAPLKASDFVYGIKRSLDPKINSKLSDLLYFIKNGVKYKHGELADFSKVGVRAVDDRTLEFDLESKFAFFPHILALSIAFPQRQDLVEKNPRKWFETMQTTGPYRIARWSHDQSIELERNPFHPDYARLPEKIDFRVIPDDSTALNLFEKGKLDVVFRFPSLDLERLKKSGLVKEFPYFATYYLAFNQRVAPWNSLEARRAFIRSVDREEIVRAVGSNESPAISWIPGAIPQSNLSIGLKKDLAAAKADWAAYSKKLKPSTKGFELGFDSGSKNQMIAEKVRSDIKASLGFDLELRARDWKSHVGALSNATPPIYRFGLMAVFIDPFAMLFIFESNNPNNYTGWKSAEYDKLVHSIASLNPLDEKEKKARQVLVDRAQKMITVDQAVVLPIYHYTSLVLHSKRLDRFKLNGLGLIDLESLKNPVKP